MEAQNPPPLTPDQFAAVISTASDEQIADGMRANRRILLDEIFRQMPENFKGEQAADLDAVVDWRITDAPDGGEDRYQMTFRSGACSVERDGPAEADLTFSIGPVDFIRLVAGHAQGPALFVFGKLRIKGDLLLAARLPGFFRIPRSG